MVTQTTPAHAAEPLAECGATAGLVLPPPGGHEITGTGSYGCDERQLQIGVIVCLVGPLVGCAPGTGSNTSSVSASVTLPCLPGVWTTVVYGSSTGGSPDVTPRPGFVMECDPLSP
jgi:hypothetical protein